MTLDDLRRFHSERPFHPFAIHVSDGAVYEVPAPEFLSYRPGTRVAFVWNISDAGYAFIDVNAITRITFSEPPVPADTGA